MKLKSFVLAAGLGERLAPITNFIPKPLLPILGKPILQLILEKISGLSINEIGINLHYKKNIIEEWVKQSNFSFIKIFPENPVLGTGGALKNAEKFLKDSVFIVHNADIYSDIDLEKLLEFHLFSGNIATLAVHDYSRFNNLVVDNNGLLCGIGTMCSLFCPPGSRIVAFTGISVYSPDILKFIPEGASSIVHTWNKIISAGHKINTYDVTGCSWNDIGTPDSYAKTIINELNKNGEMVFINPKINSCNSLNLNGYIVIEAPQKLFETSHKEQIHLKNCIILPNADFELPNYENCIIGQGFKIDLKETEILEANSNNMILIGTGGSDRKYFRIREGEKSFVLMRCENNDKDFERHIKYTKFFKKYSIPVPELIRTDFNSNTAYFEDFGDCSLYNWLKCPRNEEEISAIYKKVIDILISIHASLTEHIKECPLLEERIFDYDHLRWETGYFLKRFLSEIMKIKINNMQALEEEFHRLALKVDSFPKTIIHRDFQSQNIMIINGKLPGVIDYQGARIGPPAYDLASLLWDPYYRLNENLRQKLIDYYIYRFIETISLQKKQYNKKYNHKESNIKNHSYFINLSGKEEFIKTFPDNFYKTILPCRLQRHMQALGAYGFLSSIKGKKYFLKYIPEALRLLKEESALSKDEYPELYKVVSGL